MISEKKKGGSQGNTLGKHQKTNAKTVTWVAQQIRTCEPTEKRLKSDYLEVFWL
jgi:hypothetical protein